MNNQNAARYILLLFLLSLVHFAGLAQDLKITSKIKDYRRHVALDSAHKMIELKKVIPDLVYDLRYGTANNFMHQKLYSQFTATFLRRDVAIGLQKVATSLKAAGYGLKVFDAYRPYSVTKKMWDLIGDERYVANPAKGSGHNRGLAIDLTLIDLATGEEVPMGTGFDAFSDTAHHSFLQLPPSVLGNRRLLRATMEAAGFRALETEWWHFSWPNEKDYAVLDISFKKLKHLKF